MKAIILTAGNTDKFSGKKLDLPHCLLEINNIPLIFYTLYNCQKCGINDVIIITGFKKEKIPAVIGKSFSSMNIKFIENKNFNNTTTAYSLYQAKNIIDDDVVVIDGDILFSHEGLKEIKNSNNSNSIISVPMTGNGLEACIYDVDNKVELLIVRDEFSKIRFNLPIEIDGKKILINNLREDPGIRKLDYNSCKTLFTMIKKDIDNSDYIKKLEYYINVLLKRTEFGILKLNNFNHYKTRPDFMEINQVNSIFTAKELIEINSLIN